MFYCKLCQIENEWPSSLSMSLGKCECCGKEDLCNDMASSRLPSIKKDEGEVLYTALDLEKAYCLGFVNQSGMSIDKLASQAKHLRERVDLAIKFINKLKSQ
jgi:hypothetical protein